jgi:hypothetical protein
MRRDRKGMTARASKWSKWFTPKMKGFELECCDCGLKHEAEFTTFIETKQRGESFVGVDLPWPVGVRFRMRRK